MRRFLTISLLFAVACGGDDGPADSATTNGAPTNGDASMHTTATTAGNDAQVDSATEGGSTTGGSIPSVTCDAPQVACNGGCLGSAGDASMGCTLLRVGFDHAGGIAADAESVFYGTNQDTVEQFTVSTGAMTTWTDSVFVRGEIAYAHGRVYAVVRTSAGRGIVAIEPDGTVQRVAENIVDIRSLQAAGSELLFTGSGGVYQADLGGTGSAITLQAGGVGFVFTADASTLFLADDEIVTYSPWDAASGTALASVTSPQEIYLDADSIVWREATISSGTGLDVQFRSVPKAGGTPSTFLSGVDVGPTFAMQDGYLYALHDDLISRVRVSDGAVEEVARVGATGDELDLAMTSEHLYIAHNRPADVENGVLLQVALP